MSVLLLNMVHYSNIITPTLNPTPASSVTATFLQFPQNDGIFRASSASAPAVAGSKSIFSGNSHVIIKAVKVSIPNLPGARLALAPLVSPYDPPADNSLVIQAKGSSNSGTYTTYIPQLEEWFEWEQFISVQTDSSNFQLVTAITPPFTPGIVKDTEIGIDTRNLQPAFTTTPIDLYLKIELQVLSPFFLVG